MGGLQLNSGDARRRQRQRQLQQPQQAVVASKPKTERKKEEQTPKKRRSKKFHDDYEPRRERHSQRREYRSDRESRRRNRSSSREHIIRPRTTTLANTSFDQQSTDEDDVPDTTVDVVGAIFEGIGHAAADAAKGVSDMHEAILHAIFPVQVYPDEEGAHLLSTIGEENTQVEDEATAVEEESTVVPEKPKKKRGLFGLKRLQKSARAKKKAEDMDAEEKLKDLKDEVEGDTVADTTDEELLKKMSSEDEEEQESMFTPVSGEAQSVLSSPSTGIEAEERSATQEQTKKLKEKEEQIIMESKKLEMTKREVDEMEETLKLKELNEKELLIAEKNKALEEAMQLNMQRESEMKEGMAALEAATTELKLKEDDTQRKLKEFEQMKLAITHKEQEANAKLVLAEEQRKKLKEKEDLIIMESKKLEMSKREVDEMNANFTKREEELSKMLAAIQAGEEERRQKEREIEEQAKVVAAREQSILEKLAAAEEASISRRKKESKLKEKCIVFDLREKEISNRLAAIDAASVARRKKEQVIEGKLTSLAKREQAIDEKLASLDAASVIKRQKRVVKAKEIKMEENLKLKELNEKELLIAEKNKAVEEAMQLNMQRESEMKERMAALDAAATARTEKANQESKAESVSLFEQVTNTLYNVLNVDSEASRKLPQDEVGSDEMGLPPNISALSQSTESCISKTSFETPVVEVPSYELPLHTLGRDETESKKKRGFLRRLRQKMSVHSKKKAEDGIVDDIINTKKEKSDKKDEKTKKQKSKKLHSSYRTEASNVAAKAADNSEKIDAEEMVACKELDGNNVEGKNDFKDKFQGDTGAVATDEVIIKTMSPKDEVDSQSVVSALWSIVSGQTSWTKTGPDGTITAAREEMGPITEESIELEECYTTASNFDVENDAGVSKTSFEKLSFEAPSYELPAFEAPLPSMLAIGEEDTFGRDETAFGGMEESIVLSEQSKKKREGFSGLFGRPRQSHSVAESVGSRSSAHARSNATSKSGVTSASDRSGVTSASGERSDVTSASGRQATSTSCRSGETSASGRSGVTSASGDAEDDDSEDNSYSTFTVDTPTCNMQETSREGIRSENSLALTMKEKSNISVSGCHGHLVFEDDESEDDESEDEEIDQLCEAVCRESEPVQPLWSSLL